MDLTKMTGEQLAGILSQQYNMLIQAQGNIQAIQAELKRREEKQPEKQEEVK